MSKLETLRLSLVFYGDKPDSERILVPLGYLRALVAEHEPELELEDFNDTTAALLPNRPNGATV